MLLMELEILTMDSKQLNELFGAAILTAEPEVSRYVYKITQNVGGRTIIFFCCQDLRPEHEDEWRIDFTEELELTDENADDEDFEQYVNHKTGKGHEFEVFAFIVACAKQFVKDKDPKIIRLKSEKEEANRAPLYWRLAKRFGSGFDISQETEERHDVTVMTKKGYVNIAK